MHRQSSARLGMNVRGGEGTVGDAGKRSGDLGPLGGVQHGGEDTGADSTHTVAYNASAHIS